MNLSSTKRGRAAARAVRPLRSVVASIEGTTTLSVAHFMGGTKLFLRTAPSGGLSHQYFRSPAASNVERVHVNAMQSRRIKVLGERAESTIIVFRLAFTSPHKPCRTTSNPVQARTSNPVQVRTSNVKSKVDHSVHSSKREYSCSCHRHNINRSNLQCMKQQHAVLGKWGKRTLEFHERSSWKPKCGAGRSRLS